MSKDWGPITWFFFHTFSQKINERFFNYYRIHCLNLLFSICVNLPCQECAGHAKKYLKLHRFYNIQTKQHLIAFFYNFHNAVNKRTKKKECDTNILKIYKHGNMIQILQLFYTEFNKPVLNNDYLLSLYKKQTINNTYKFIINNKKYFL